MGVSKSERVSARVTVHIYNMLAQAAELSGATMNQFLVQSALEKAQAVIEKERVINMTIKSSSVFFKAMDKPPAPSRKLKTAVKSYKKRLSHAKD